MTVCKILLICLLCTQCSCGSTCGNKRDSNLQGRLVYINIATYRTDESIHSADDCCKACDKFDWLCTGWSYCNDPNGCGTGCSQYMSSWKEARDNWNPFIDNYAPLDYTEESMQADMSCGDKWPHKTCSFKLVDGSSTEITQGIEASGWISGDTGVMYEDSWKCSFNDPRGCCGLSPALYQCADSTCDIRQSNIQADLLQFDVNFERYARYGGTIGASPLECCNLCKERDDCDAWVFCNREEGCGSGCKATIQDLNDMYDGTQLLSTNPLAKLSEQKLCTDDDRFEFRLCSLKKFKDGQYSEVTQGEAALGWVSGIPTAKSTN
eukprot:TRINITY_DN729_c0_g1_i7.p1 TRINITY_DN729_c0_g1~~TRINITY_DN729_c0_g1_i7.p1  ORF type:complete len:367 (+),score=42.65 TRINITY_DN729_c0_g1_i7:135-1103(+)